MVGSSGLEPPTSRLSGVRSNRLSYEPSSGHHKLLITSSDFISRVLTYIISTLRSLGLVFLVLLASYVPFSFYGGDERDRTADPLLARQVLSQLSYTPTLLLFFKKLHAHKECSFAIFQLLGE